MEEEVNTETFCVPSYELKAKSWKEGSTFGRE